MHVIFVPYAIMKTDPASWLKMVTRFKGNICFKKFIYTCWRRCFISLFAWWSCIDFYLWSHRWLLINPLECRGNHSATSNNMKLVHWPLTGWLLHLVQRGGAWTGCGPA